MRTYWPLKELFVIRTKEFFREPEAIFWVYVFPILLIVLLGIAFREGEVPAEVRVAVVDAAGSEDLARSLENASRWKFVVERRPLEQAKALGVSGKVDVVLDAREGTLRYIYDPARDGSEAASLKVDAALQGAAGRKDPVSTEVVTAAEPGSRYIDWLVPGLIGLNIMGGGLWGLGFVTVDLRMRKLLKRFVATPMRRSDFLAAILGSRTVFLVPEIIVIFLAGKLFFGLEMKGSALDVAVVSLVGAICFGGIGLLVGCRTDKIETINGLLNVTMLPMWLFSGVFFSSERFPDVMQPLIQALPLTQLNMALRAVILDGASLGDQWLRLVVMTVMGALAFAGALRWFRWT
jgi:ABC-type multidrug transport system permease subunit